MARAHPALIDALRRTADRLDAGSRYRWSHYGMCNCGHLAQTVTELSPREIHEAAMARAGDWGEQAREYCGHTGLPIDHIIAQLLDLGLDRGDIHDLERLQDHRVIQRLPPGQRKVRNHARVDVVRYMRAWADLLEEEWQAGQQRLREAAK